MTTTEPAITVSDHALLNEPLDSLMTRAALVRDAAFGTRITYSPKVFIPLTLLCNDWQRLLADGMN